MTNINTSLLKVGNMALIKWCSSSWDGWRKIVNIDSSGISVHSNDIGFPGYFRFSYVLDVRLPTWKERLME